MRHISVQPKCQELYVVLEVPTIGAHKFLMIFIYEVYRTLSCLSDLVSQYACHIFLFNCLRSLSFQYVSDIVYYEWLWPLPIAWYASCVNVTKCQFVMNVLGATTKHMSPRQLMCITRNFSYVTGRNYKYSIVVDLHCSSIDVGWSHMTHILVVNGYEVVTYMCTKWILLNNCLALTFCLSQPMSSHTNP